MYFPKLNAPRQSRVTVNRFPGLDRRPRGQEGSFREMENLCAQGYPTLTVRRPRGIAGSVTAPGGLTAKDGLIWVDGHTLYINGSAAGLVLSEGKKQLVSMGAWLLIWPDKLYINTKDLTDFGSLENKPRGRYPSPCAGPTAQRTAGIWRRTRPRRSRRPAACGWIPAAMRLPCGSMARTAGRRWTTCAWGFTPPESAWASGPGTAYPSADAGRRR